MADMKQAFSLSTTSLTCMLSFVHSCANKLLSRSGTHRSTNDGEASRSPSNEGYQNTPPSRKVDPDSHIWDKDTIKTYFSESLLPSEAPSMPSIPLMPSQEDHGRISVDSKDSGRDVRQVLQDWLEIKAKRNAEQKDAIATGRWVER